jgi:tRNA threonylcarbamoyladenosine biosynthesis protein TsaB
MHTPCLLALDTATETLAIAARGPLGEHVHESAGGALASAQLIPQALALLAQAGARLAEVQAIAFGAGPGAFTGLRTACSVAQGLALGLGKPVLPIDCLLLVAEDALAQLSTREPQTIWVAMDARMGEVYAQACHWSGQHWQIVVPALLCKPEDLHTRWQATPPAVVAGSALGAFGDRLGLTAHTQQLPQTRSRAGALLRLASAAWARGEGIDAALALPVYVRDKVAQTTAEREALRQAGAAA